MKKTNERGCEDMKTDAYVIPIEGFSAVKFLKKGLAKSYNPRIEFCLCIITDSICATSDVSMAMLIGKEELQMDVPPGLYRIMSWEDEAYAFVRVGDMGNSPLKDIESIIDKAKKYPLLHSFSVPNFEHKYMTQPYYDIIRAKNIPINYKKMRNIIKNFGSGRIDIYSILDDEKSPLYFVNAANGRQALLMPIKKDM